MISHSSDINILIADDNPDHLRIATTILKKLNYPIRIATNGIAAYNLIKIKIPTLILLDVTMPEMDGFTLCNTLKNNSKYRDIPIIFMTAANDLESINKGFEYGAQDYVLKPYNESEFLARIRTHLSLRLKTLQLETAYADLDSFCYTVSHDLKSPVRVLNELVSLLQTHLEPVIFASDSSSSPIAPEYDIDKIIDILNRLSNKSNDILCMIDRLLELSRIQQKQLKLEPIDLNLLIEELNEELLINEPERDIEFSISELPIITGDITLIYFLFQNIISNALKFTRTRTRATISISYESFNDYYEIYICDNGVGFNSKYESKLFKLFERLHSQKEFEGSGVGLNISKKIVAKHDGEISITSNLGAGATVCIMLLK